MGRFQEGDMIMTDHGIVLNIQLLMDGVECGLVCQND